MKWRSWLLLAVAGGVALIIWLLLGSAPKFPVAELRVVDASGKGVAGAVIQPEGLRTKPGPYISGWYSWRTEADSPTNAPVTTDQAGCASVPYPRYVFERIETGTLCLAVNHPDYVPERPERVVTTALPAGAPWRVIAADLWDRIQHKALLAHADPIVLKKGATLMLSAQPGSGAPEDAPLYAQVSSVSDLTGTNFWTRPKPGLLLTRRLAEGTATIRALRFGSHGSVWFSDTFSVKVATGKTNELAVALKPGVTVHGQLDAAAPRPIKNGRAIVHVWPMGENPQNSPPEWHSWASIRADGSFEIPSLPAGDLEILALCDGYVSTNGPGKFHMRYPQKYVLGTTDLSVVIGMEPTARLEVLVTDDKGRPLKDAVVSTWPNARYGEWSAVVLASDCYRTADLFSAKSNPFAGWWHRAVPSDFTGTSDANGLAVVPNLPADVSQFTVEHERYVLPAVSNAWGKHREATVTLQAGITNHAAVQLEPKGSAPITHY